MPEADLIRSLSRIEDKLDDVGAQVSDVRERVARIEGERAGGLQSWQVFAGGFGILLSLSLGVAGLLLR